MTDKDPTAHLPEVVRRLIEIGQRLGVEGESFSAEEVLYTADANRRAEREEIVRYLRAHAKPLRQPVRRHLEAVAEAVEAGRHRGAGR